jgi:hypothetical protein
MRRLALFEEDAAGGSKAVDRPPEFADIPDEIRAMSRAQLERVATPALNRLMDTEKDRVTSARAELVWRDHEFEREMSTAADARQARQQKSDEELEQRQIDHAAKLAKEQLDTAHAAARAAKWAAVAAGVAALGAIGQLVVAIVGSLLAPS